MVVLIFFTMSPIIKESFEKIINSLAQSISSLSEENTIKLLLPAYNRVRSDEYDGTCYIFSLSSKEDIKALIEWTNIPIKDFLPKLFADKNKEYGYIVQSTEQPYFQTSDKSQISLILKGSSYEILFYMFALPYVKEYSELYTNIIGNLLMENKESFV